MGNIEAIDSKVGDSPKLAVGIATTGRIEVVCVVLEYLRRQTRPPDLVIIVGCDPADTPSANGDGLRCIISERGLTKQRNVILREASQFDMIVFLDDDFLPSPTYLEEVEKIIAVHQDVAMVTGQVVADGIIGPGLSLEQARQYLAADVPTGLPPPSLLDIYNGYGCNMAVRVRAVKEAAIQFDERLPLYGWLEDVDFSRRLRRFGRIVRWTGARGVHLGVKSGRQSGVRLGYSQIANPIYLARKGTFAWSRATWHMSRNVAMNVLRFAQPEPYIDRRGRLRGNMIAIADLFGGRLRPERASAI